MTRGGARARRAAVRVAVVGAGIAGLAAAHDLAAGGADVVVLEASPRAGGKLRTEPFAGVDLETAPDSFLARRPEAVDLCRELGLADELVAPSETSAYVFARGRLRRLPGGTVLGVPTDDAGPGPVRRPLSRGRGPRGDRAVAAGSAAGRRHDRRRADRSPLRPRDVGPPRRPPRRRHQRRPHGSPLGRRRRHRNWLRPPGATARCAGPALGPGTERGGRGSGVPDAPGRAVPPRRRARVGDRHRRRRGAPRRGRPVAHPRRRRLRPRRREPERGRRRPGRPRHAGRTVTAGLVAPTAPEASAILGAVSYASVALVTLAFPEAAVRRPLDASGFVVPRPEGLTMTGCTWADRKWAHLRRPGQLLVRASAGRVDNDDAALPDDELLGRLLADLGDDHGPAGRAHRGRRAPLARLVPPVRPGPPRPDGPGPPGRGRRAARGRARRRRAGRRRHPGLHRHRPGRRPPTSSPAEQGRDRRETTTARTAVAGALLAALAACGGGGGGRDGAAEETTLVAADTTTTTTPAVAGSPTTPAVVLPVPVRPPEPRARRAVRAARPDRDPQARPRRRPWPRASPSTPSTAPPGTGPAARCPARSATSSSPATGSPTPVRSATSTGSSPATRSSSSRRPAPRVPDDPVGDRAAHRDAHHRADARPVRPPSSPATRRASARERYVVHLELAA